LSWLKDNPNAEDWKVKDKFDNLKDEIEPIIAKAQEKKQLSEKIEDIKEKAKDGVKKSEKKRF